MARSPCSFPVRYEYEKGWKAPVRYHQVWDRLTGDLVSSHETYSAALAKVERLNAEWVSGKVSAQQVAA